jgi:hypothetical protein
VIRVLVPLLWLAATVSAQWINYPVHGTPRTKDGKPNLTAPAPKARDGKPDLSGIWEGIDPAVNRAVLWKGDAGNGFDTADDPSFDLENFMPEGAKIPMRPEAATLFQQRVQSFAAGRPSGRCLPHGIPDAMLIGADFKIVQNPGLTLILYEEFNHYRQVFTDGRNHPGEMTPAWFGYSIGKWDRDAFVVDTAGFNDRTWLDDHGHPHTEALHTIERFRRRDFGHMEMQLTIDDPKAYTAPWTAAMQFRLLPDTDLIEDVCDNERDSRHEVAK